MSQLVSALQTVKQGLEAYGSLADQLAQQQADQGRRDALTLQDPKKNALGAYTRAYELVKGENVAQKQLRT